jgi:phosphatidylserine/phosphatidylglycerophosphate/cardiolipin synthase-like enzyme
MKSLLQRLFTRKTLLFAAVMLVASACLLEVTPQVTTIPPDASPEPSNSIEIYFTDPTSPAAPSLRGGIDELLVANVDRARVSVDVAIYDLNLWSLRDALVHAYQRGVRVRVVTESDNLDEPEIQRLREAGIEVLGDRRESLMHNKFIIIDGWEVWTGSANFTTSDVYYNDNNLVRIRSTRLAQDYTVEFEEMFLDDQFGAISPANTPYPSVMVDGTLIEVYFAPEDGVLANLLELVGGAQHSIDFLAFSFTSDELAAAMLERAGAGVGVRGIFDEHQYNSNIGAEFDRLLNAGLDVRLDGNPDHMHHKVLIIDEQIVVSGSYNFSDSAEASNDENVLVIHSPAIAAQFLAEFQRIYDQAQR